jgi:hypothetical protein
MIVSSFNALPLKEEFGYSFLERLSMITQTGIREIHRRIILVSQY